MLLHEMVMPVWIVGATDPRSTDAKIVGIHNTSTRTKANMNQWRVRGLLKHRSDGRRTNT